MPEFAPAKLLQVELFGPLHTVPCFFFRTCFGRYSGRFLGQGVGCRVCCMNFATSSKPGY